MSTTTTRQKRRKHHNHNGQKPCTARGCVDGTYTPEFEKKCTKCRGTKVIETKGGKARELCMQCDKDGKIKRKGKPVQCIRCNGTGKMSVHRKRKVVAINPLSLYWPSPNKIAASEPVKGTAECVEMVS